VLPEKAGSVVDLTLTSTSGQRLFDFKYNVPGNDNLIVMDLTEYARGIYFVHLHSGESRWVQKVILE
jgi:hypothetical protein